MPVIPAAQETEIRRISVQSHPGQIVPQDPISKKNLHKKRAGGVAQGSNPSTTKKKKKKYVLISCDKNT
jgi:hypothetical protein